MGNKSKLSGDDPDKPEAEAKPPVDSARSKKKKRRFKTKKPALKREDPDKPNEKSEIPAPISSEPAPKSSEMAPKPPPLEVVAPKHKFSEPAPLSPRKQTIMRYKKSDDHEPSLIHEAKGNLKTQKAVGSNNPIDEDDRYSSLLAQQNMEGKASLFKFENSKISVFHEQISDDASTTSSADSSGRLLSRGEFEIFQLHNGDVTYLSCGRSFVYPLLPKLKILRIGFNQFILPLVNPERYWKIYITTDDETIITQLENTLKSVVQYRNLGFNQTLNPEPQLTTNGTPAQPIPLHEHIPQHALDKTPEKPKQFGMFADIPESPPSAPFSPHPVIDSEYSDFVLSSQNPPLTPGWSLNRQKSMNSVTSAMASLDLKAHQKPNNIVGVHDYNQILPSERTHKPPKLHQPRPTKYSPHLSTQETLINSHPKYKSSEKHKEDAKSDSSMDSLLDEYEENISISKSYSFSVSKPPSRPLSLISGRQPSNFHYQRSVDILKDLEQSLVDDDDEENDNEFDDGEDFPTTSLSEYNRNRNNKTGYNRSRRSSNSELYTSVSNWMEPGKTDKNPVPKKAYSVSNGYHESYKQPVSRSGQDLNQAYKNIYKSITQRNLSQYLEPEFDDSDTKSRKSGIDGHDRGGRIKALQRQLTRQPIKMTSSSNLHRQSSYAGSLVHGSRNGGHLGDRSRSGSVSRYSEMSSVLHSQSYSQLSSYRSQPKLRQDVGRGRDKLELRSADVYLLISANRPVDTKKKEEARGGFASRLFGW